MGRRLSDPSWKSGPSYPEPTASEHAIDVEPSGVDMDGFGQDEAERVEGEPLVTVQEYYGCSRDGCDEGMTRRLLFTTQPLTSIEEVALRSVAADEVGEGEGAVSEYVWQHAKQVDVETIEVPIGCGTLQIPTEDVVEDGARGDCYGHEDPATRLGI